MQVEDKIRQVKELIAKREEIDRKLAALFGETVRKPQACSKCGQEGHSARTCTAA